MSNIHENHSNEQIPSNYVTINGEKVTLTDEQKRAWYSMVNKTRRYARDFNTCDQPDFRKCCGDCSICAFQRTGAFIYADDHEKYVDGFAEGPLAPADSAPTPEEEAVRKDKWAWLYREADGVADRGRDILFLSMEEGLSAHQISQRTGIAKSTVVDRLNRLLDFIRNHRDELI